MSEVKLIAICHSVALACALGVGLISTAKADTWIDVHGLSKHSQSTYRDKGVTREFNETNLGLGAEVPIARNFSLILGGYRNSYYRTSLYAGMDIHTNPHALTGVGVMTGIISGYDETPVLALPYYRIGNEHVRVKFGVIPGKIQVVTMTLGFRF